MEHTPGPWVDESGVIHAPVGSNIIHPARITDYFNSEEAQANARLIAASPDLLAALESMVSITPEDQNNTGIVASARRAIEKARNA